MHSLSHSCMCFRICSPFREFVCLYASLICIWCCRLENLKELFSLKWFDLNFIMSPCRHKPWRNRWGNAHLWGFGMVSSGGIGYKRCRSNHDTIWHRLSRSCWTWCNNFQHHMAKTVSRGWVHILYSTWFWSSVCRHLFMLIWALLKYTPPPPHNEVRGGGVYWNHLDCKHFYLPHLYLCTLITWQACNLILYVSCYVKAF